MTDEVKVSFGADTTELQQQMAQATASVKAATQAIGTSMHDAVQRQNAQMRDYQAQINAAAREHERLAEQVYVVNDAYQKSGGAAHQLGTQTASASREVFVLAHELAMGNFSRIPGSIMELTMYMGGFKNMVAGVGAALASPLAAAGALAAAVATLTAAFIHAENEEERMNIALKTTSDYSGQTTADMHALARSISDTSNVSTYAATEMVTTLAQSGRFATESYDAVSHAAAKYASITGNNAAQAAAWAEKIFTNPSRGAKELNDQYHFLSSAELGQIDALEQNGQAQEAAALLANKYIEAMKGINKELGFFGGLAKTAADDWEYFTQKLAHFAGIADNTRDKLQAMEQALELAKANLARDGGNNAFDQDRVKYFQMQVNLLKAQAGYQEKLAKLAADKAQTNAIEQVGHDIAASTNTEYSRRVKLLGDIAQLQKSLAAQEKSGATNTAEYIKELAAYGTKSQELAKLDHPGDYKKTTAKSKMSTYESGLHSAQERMMEQQGRALSAQEEEQYWLHIKQLANNSAADRASIDRKIVDAHITVLKEAKKQAEALDKVRIDDREKLAAAEITSAEEGERAKLAVGKITNAEFLTEERQFEDARYQNTVYGIQERIKALQDDPTKNAAQLKQLNDQLMVLEVQHQTQIRKINADTAKAVQQEYEARMKPITNMFSNMMTGIVMGTSTMQKAVQNIFQSILASFINELVQKMVTHWAAAEAQKTMATLTGAAAQKAVAVSSAAATTTAKATEATAVIGANAGEAASASAASVASIPVTGWAMVPAVFASTMALVKGALSSVGFSAAGGFDIPSGMNPVTQLHQSEMVLPAPLANTVRNMAALGLSAVDAGNNGQATTQQHIHLNVTALDAKGVKQFMIDNKTSIAEAMRSAARGAFPINPNTPIGLRR